MQMKARIALVVLCLFFFNPMKIWAQESIVGSVFWDVNHNRLFDPDEKGVENVCVSNGREVVQTDGSGAYSLPVYNDMVVFVVKPAGWMTPLNQNNMPLFSYVHKPKGSPPEIKQFRRISPTGQLPDEINFPLYKVEEPLNFKAAVVGDPQVYNDLEIDYLKSSLVAEVRSSDALFCITEGDNVSDDLSLLPHYFDTMGQMGIPVYYTPGNHDMNYEAVNDKDSLDTFKSYVGATYYSFNYGMVHFVVLDTMEYPSAVTNGSYTGKIDEIQMQWLANDLAFVPMDHLIVLNMHIPLVSDINRNSLKHQVENRQELYSLLKGRKAISLAGHTHTLARFLPGDELEGWGDNTPIEQTIVGAASGSWWSGDLDASGVPFSYMRCGAPRGHMIYAFKQSNYTGEYRAHGRSEKQQMHLSFINHGFESWFDAVSNQDPEFEVDNLDYLNLLSQDDLASGGLVANIWSASRHARVMCRFDDRPPVTATWNMELKDPIALAAQLYVTKDTHGGKGGGTNGGQPPYTSVGVSLPKYYWTVENRSTHLWHCPLPSDLDPGSHSVAVEVQNVFGHTFEEVKYFDISDS